MQKTLLLVVPLFAVACSYPRFVASKIVELDVPLAEASKLDCKTHNGNITITPGELSDTIHIRAEIKVRGYTQEEAEDNLAQLSIGQKQDNDVLRIFGEYPRSHFSNTSPSFSFDIKVPEHLALALESHNGNLTSHGTSGPLRLETHNGRIEGATSNNKAWVETHNGSIKLAIHSDEDLDGSITSHNGGISVEVSDQAHGWLEIATHNGSIKTPSTIHDATIKRRSVRGRLGEGATNGRLVVTTHNGNVVVRDDANASNNEPK
jgi:DUF4097 and DUF4098 domain-containing protein YvlB